MEEQTWQLLLNLRRQVCDYPEELQFCVWPASEPGAIGLNQVPQRRGPWIWVAFGSFKPKEQRPGDSLFRVKDLLEISLEDAGVQRESLLATFSAYLPYCFLSLFARRQGRALSVGHFAQSLDGKIATRCGHSRWIGDEANLLHAHRMRALCDGILIGRHTLINDRPRLTVRKVNGPNPVRIVLGTQIDEYGCLLSAAASPVLLIHRKPQALKQASVSQLIYEGPEAQIPCQFILENLYLQGIHSVLIEGGAQTSSRFLTENLLDIVQLHLAPIVLGSGRDSFCLPEIHRIEHAVGFRRFFFQQVADTVMFVGQPEVQHALVNI